MDESKKENSSILVILQNTIRLLFLKGLDSNDIHNIVEVAFSNAFDEFYIES